MRREMNEDERQALYMGIGMCIWNVQYVEDALHTLLALKVDIKQPGIVGEEDAYSMLKKHRRATLGTAIRVAKDNHVLPSDLMAELTVLKEERDWLVHRAQHQNGEDLYTDEGRLSFFNRLEKLVIAARDMQKSITSQVSLFAQSHGLNTRELAEKGAQKIAALKGGN